MTLRKSVVPAALALAGCLAGESEQPPPPLESMMYQTPIDGGSCVVEHVSYRVHGSIDPGVTSPKSRTSMAALLVTLSESSSVVQCDEDVMRISVPGADLKTAAFAPSSEEFKFDVPGVVIGGHRPSFYVRALLDENDNGHCDDGELVGFAELTDVELGDIALELSRDEGCPVRT